MTRRVTQLHSSDYAGVRPLFEPLEFHLAISSGIARDTPASIYVDNRDHPRAVLMQTGHRFYLAGNPDIEEFNTGVGRLFAESIYPRALAAGRSMFVLYHVTGGWEEQIDTLLPDKQPLRDRCEYYEFRALREGWQDMIPDGFGMRSVNRALLRQTQLRNLAALTEELCSERPSVSAFLARSFGVCILREDEIVACCLSEYNRPGRCEVGIATVKAYQRRGLATFAASALVDRALTRGITRIGWHCWADNRPSGATARKAGFDRLCDYPAFYAWFDVTANLAVHGNVALRSGCYEDADGWFGRALASGDAAGWVYFGAACAAAQLGQEDRALDYLARAIERGFTNRNAIAQSQHLDSLHGTERWAQIIRATVCVDAEPA